MAKIKHLCQCGCGQETRIIEVSDPRWGRVKGQYSRFVQGHGGNYIHGQTRDGQQSSTYKSWAQMVQRCTNSNNPEWENYGGRGIGIDDPRWLVFENFLADMGEKPRLRLTIERRDNESGYSKANCYWGTYKQQNNNRRSRYRDKTHCDRGHPLSGDNLFIRPSGGKQGGGRGCRICQREANERFEEKRKLARAAASAAKTHCPNGHKLTPDNRIATGGGGFRCRICAQEAAARPRK